MFKVGDFVVYKKDVAKIVGTKVNQLNNQEYYILVPINDDSLKIDVPLYNRLGNIRNLVSKERIIELIKEIPNIPLVDNTNKLIENDYRELLKEGSYESLIRIIKTTYLRNKERVDNNKKKGDKDEYYFNLAEKYLYTEFSLVLGLSYDETRDYIKEEVEKIVNEK